VNKRAVYVLLYTKLFVVTSESFFTSSSVQDTLHFHALLTSSDILINLFIYLFFFFKFLFPTIDATLFRDGTHHETAWFTQIYITLYVATPQLGSLF